MPQSVAASSRLSQTLGHLQAEIDKRESKLSLLQGSTGDDLLNITLGQLLDTQAEKYPAQDAVVRSAHDEYPEQRTTYEELRHNSKELAKALLASGVRKGDRIAILSANDLYYVSLIFAVGRIGAISAVLNTKWNLSEIRDALLLTEPTIVFIARCIGSIGNTPTVDMLTSSLLENKFPHLAHIEILDGNWVNVNGAVSRIGPWYARGGAISDVGLAEAEDQTWASDTCNLQFTSGTSGQAKVVQLTHRNIINNGKFSGDRMRLTERDILCCPPPLFHCFGLVLGLLACVTHGSTIVFASEAFDPKLCVKAISRERCTALHGVPTMFDAILAEESLSTSGPYQLRTGIIAGAPAPRQLMEQLQYQLNLYELTNAFGMTETSPASFMTTTKDTLERRLATVGSIMPHTQAKVINSTGHIVPRGTRGEVCVAGYLVQKGYWRNPEKTAEVMKKDSEGTVWMHTGDEGMIDEEGYCHITGRIKDMIIRGGENIYPFEIEDRLLQHPAIAQVSVVGLPNDRYGETVAAFLKAKPGAPQPLRLEVQNWIGETLARYKTPQHVFWLRGKGMPSEMPQTASGKIQKHILREIGKELAAQGLGQT